MSETQLSTDTSTEAPETAPVPLRFEAVVLPVADADRSKAFYGHGRGLGSDGHEPGRDPDGASYRHDAFEKAAPAHDWWDWYAAYFDARERGSGSDEASAAAERYMAEVKGVVVSR